MEQAESIQLVSPDFLLETVNAMAVPELEAALNGIARASTMVETAPNESLDNVIEASSPSVDEAKAVTVPFGGQLMETIEWTHGTEGDPSLETKEPAPTFSPKGGIQAKDDGGTGPSIDE